MNTFFNSKVNSKPLKRKGEGMDHFTPPPYSKLHGLFLYIRDHVNIRFFTQVHLGHLDFMIKKGNASIAIYDPLLTETEDIFG